MFSYLVGREQSVVDDTGGLSAWCNVTRGVPQGSVLGPLLFLLFINNVGSNLRYTNRMVFADDTQIYLHCLPCSELNTGIVQMTYDVNVINDFAASNGLKLNASKTKALIVRSNAFIRTLDLNNCPSIRLGSSTSLPYVSHARNLGVLITSDLSWNKHINLLSQKVHSALHKLKFNINAIPVAARATLIQSLVFPRLVFNDVTGELNAKSQRLINSCVRFIFNSRRDTSITPYRLSLNWLSTANHRTYFLGIAAYRISRNDAPTYILELLPHDLTSVRRSERTNDLSSVTFQIPTHRTCTYHNSFRLSAAYLWHSLSPEPKASPSLSIFKLKFHRYLLDSELSGELLLPLPTPRPSFL